MIDKETCAGVFFPMSHRDICRLSKRPPTFSFQRKDGPLSYSFPVVCIHPGALNKFWKSGCVKIIGRMLCQNYRPYVVTSKSVRKRFSLCMP